MSKRSILVVDDDKNTRDYLAAFLGASGFAVECLGSGDEVIERGRCAREGYATIGFGEASGRILPAAKP